MISDSIWVVGPSRSGKTTRLVENLCHWWLQHHNSALFDPEKPEKQTPSDIQPISHWQKTHPGALVLAANSDNRRILADRITTATQGKYPVRVKTMMGFFQDEVILFWPLLISSLNLKAQFPIRLHPETEQQLATKLWRSQLDAAILRRAGVNEYRLVRRILDFLQLAAYSGTPCENIGEILHTGLQENFMDLSADFVASLLLDWRTWCLERGLLTYGIITELYSQQLFSHHHYQQQLNQRYQAILADDVDDYPAVARQLFDFLLDQGAAGGFSYNPNGAPRLGLGADPDYLQGLAQRCRIETLTTSPLPGLADRLLTPMVELVTTPILLSSLPRPVQLIKTTSRAQLLRETAQEISQAIKSGKVKPEEVAIIAPGLDAIARYTLVEILTKQNIPIQSPKEQRPLITSSVIRGLLTMLTLVYPGLGRLVHRDAVAEMLVILSRNTEVVDNSASFSYRIDPVRAGLIADSCFVPHPDHPHLLPVTAFQRWDRIGYAATTAYDEILQWLQKQRAACSSTTLSHSRSISHPTSVLFLAIQDFLLKNNHLPYDQMAAIRELLETAQHYWEINTRLEQGNITINIAEFIQLLRSGTITANPYPLQPIGPSSKAVTLTTIFQYRCSRKFHPWHFWLDVGSPLWAKGGASVLFGSPLFLQHRLGQPWRAEEENLLEATRLPNILADLLTRVGEKLYLCHSDLAINGQEQMGPMLPLVYSFM